jgi:hypothetical protein
MKKIITVLVAVAAFSISNGQAITIGPGDTVNYSGNLNTIDDQIELTGSFVNNNATDSALWVLKSADLPTDWEMSLCDPNNCYILYPGDNTVRSFEAVSGQSYELKFGATPYCNAGAGNFEVTFWLKSDSANTAKRVVFNSTFSGTCTTGINDVIANNLQIYPAPFTNSFTISGLNNTTADTKVKLYDLNGKVVFEKVIGNVNGNVSVTPDLNAKGVYVLTVESGNTRLLSTNIEKR